MDGEKNTMLTHNRKTGLAILISFRANFKVSKVMRDKEGYYIMIKRSILQEDVTILNVSIPNKRASFMDGRNTRWHSHFGRQFGGFLIN